MDQVRLVRHINTGNFGWTEVEVVKDVPETMSPVEALKYCESDIQQYQETFSVLEAGNITTSVPAAAPRVTARIPVATAAPIRAATPTRAFNNAPRAGNGYDMTSRPYAVTTDFKVTGFNKSQSSQLNQSLKGLGFRWNGDGDKLWYGEVYPAGLGIDHCILKGNIPNGVEAAFGDDNLGF